MDTFSNSLRHWRGLRRYSQLDLALEAEVSSRHISFLETGRARPSAEMIGRLGEALELPFAARNQMLAQAGFAPRYAARDWQAPEMAPIRQAVRHMLENHAPFPALAIDQLWCVEDWNGPAKALFGLLDVGVGDSLLEVMTGGRAEEIVENWPQVAAQSARRLRTESAAQGGVPALDRVAERLAQVPGGGDVPDLPVVPTVLRIGDLRVSLFATIAQFGTPDDLTLEGLKVELYFPADDESARVLAQLASWG